VLIYGDEMIGTRYGLGQVPGAHVVTERVRAATLHTGEQTAVVTGDKGQAVPVTTLAALLLLRFWFLKNRTNVDHLLYTITYDLKRKYIPRRGSCAAPRTSAAAWAETPAHTGCH
jgi:hypothetical protein